MRLGQRRPSRRLLGAAVIVEAELDGIGWDFAASGEGCLLYRLRLEGSHPGPPILTGVRLWLFDRHDWDKRLTAMCPFHGGRFEVTEMMLGEEVPCPDCGETLKLNPLVCDNADGY